MKSLDCRCHPAEYVMRKIDSACAPSKTMQVALQKTFDIGEMLEMSGCLQRRSTFSLLETILAVLASVLWDLPLPHSHRLIGATGQFVPDLLKLAFHALLFNGREGHSVNARSAIVIFGPLECGA